ncbi:MAG: hypothetical protein AAF840_06115, partial [Bacteroidota bacterium]
LVFIGLGTNLFYYTVEAPDMTHSYLFTLYAIFLYCFSKVVEGTTAKGRRKKWLVYCGLIAGLMCLVRSSEIVVFALPAFYGLRNWTTLQQNFWRTLVIFGIAVGVFCLQLVYYKVGTGYWFQDGYAGLGFDWLSPHLYEGFLGYRRGWLVYTPLMILGLAGIFWLRRPWFLPILIFTIGNCYLLFSWHIWWYGDTFGSRPVVQSYAVLAMPFAALLAWMMGAAAGARKGKGVRGERSKGVRSNSSPSSFTPFSLYSVIPLLLFPFIALNLFQHWQYNQRILPLDFVNKTYYWHVFGKTDLDKKDRVFLDTNEKLANNHSRVANILALDTLVSVPPKASQEFTNLLEHKVSGEQLKENLWIMANFEYAYFGDRYDKWKFPSIVTEHRREAAILKWVQVNIPRTMTTPAGDALSFSISLPNAQEGDVVKQYVWNLSQDSMVVQSYTAELLAEE